MTAFGEYADDDTASTLKARDYKDATDLILFSTGDDGSDATVRMSPTIRASHAVGLASASGVRRLTPLESERLQGFPDGWTDTPGNTDSSRYKQMGNAVAVPVVEWIMRRIADA